MLACRGGEQRSNHLVAEYHQSDHGAQTFRKRFVSPGVAALLDEFLSTELFDVVGGLTGTVFGFRLTAALTNLGGQF